MKVIFLDVDGVLNCAEYMHKTARGGIVGIDPWRVVLLHRILEATGAKVVVSSSWRLGEGTLAEVRKACEPHFHDVTPSLWVKGMNVPRGAEISTWLFNHPEVTRYAVLDDESDAGVGHKGSFFKTEWNGDGLDENVVADVIAHLNK